MFGILIQLFKAIKTNNCKKKTCFRCKVKCDLCPNHNHKEYPYLNITEGPDINIYFKYNIKIK